ncbi:MAG: hypothetical protein ACYC6M_16185, partial [Terriglobales bacterium]
GPGYATMGYESVFVYSGRRYDSIIVYETWAHRSQPNWISLQIGIFNDRSRGVLAVPPRTLVQQNTIIEQNITNVTNVTNNVTNNKTTYNTTVLAPTAKVVAAKGLKTVPLDSATRVQAKQQAAAVQQVALQRTATERPLPPGAPRQARVASLSVPKTLPVQAGFVAPKVTAQAVSHAQAAQPFRPAPVSPHSFSIASQPGGRHLASPGAPYTPGRLGTSSIPPTHAGPLTAPPYRGASMRPPGFNPAAQHLQLGQPPRGMPGLLPRPTGQPPMRRPPPKENREHH